MGQQEVYDFLRSRRKPYSSKEIAEGLNVMVGSVRTSLSKLLKNGDIKIVQSGYSYPKDWKYEVKI